VLVCSADRRQPLNVKKAAVPEPVPPVEVAPPNGETAARKRRVLIVDDSETACKQIQIYLETESSISVDTASNGSEALKALLNGLIVLW
jgi:PleD family two-component response regulator